MLKAGLDCEDEVAPPVSDPVPLPLGVAVPFIAVLSVLLWVGAWRVWVAVFGH